MTSLGSGLAVEEALGETSTSGVTGTEAGDGFAFFLGILAGWLPELLLKNERGITISICLFTMANESSDGNQELTRRVGKTDGCWVGLGCWYR
jgi:hypothetical protein